MCDNCNKRKKNSCNTPVTLICKDKNPCEKKGNLLVSNKDGDKVTDINQETSHILANHEELQFENAPEISQGAVTLGLSKSFKDKLDEAIKNKKVEVINKNVGSGVGVYKDSIENSEKNKEYNFKTLKAGVGITIQEQEENTEILLKTDEDYLKKKILEVSPPVVFDPPVEDGGSVGRGIPIYQKLEDKRIKLSTLKSKSLDINKDEDGTINIEVIDKNFGYLKAFYVNNTYEPTKDSPSDGSVIRPFKTWEEAKKAVIGNGNILRPQNLNARIILQTDARTDINPTINTVTVEIQNNNIFFYDGADDYMFDSEVLVNMAKVDKGGGNYELSYDIYFGIAGNGILSRSKGTGHIRAIGSNRPTEGIPASSRYVKVTIGENSTDSISITERTNYPEYTWFDQLISNGGATQQSIRGTEMKYTTSAMITNPLIKIIGDNGNIVNSPVSSKGDIKLDCFANTGVYIRDCIFTTDRIYINPIVNRIFVKSGTMTNNTHPSYYEYESAAAPAFYCQNSLFYVNSIYHNSGGTMNHMGWNTFFEIVGWFKLNGTINYDTSYYIETFFNLRDYTAPGNYVSNKRDFYVNGRSNPSNINCRIKNLFVFPTGVRDKELNAIMPSTILNTNNYKTARFTESGLKFNVDTLGTLSSINSVPFITVPHMNSANILVPEDRLDIEGGNSRVAAYGLGGALYTVNAGYTNSLSRNKIIKST